MIAEQRDIFISLNSADKVWGDWIVYHLKRNGYTLYYQFDDFPPGSDFMELMNVALSNCKLTVAIWTSNYFDSSFASLEGRIALKKSLAKGVIAYVPVKVEDCTVDALFSTRVYINIVNQKRQFEAQKLLIAGVQAAFVQLKAETKSTNFSEVPQYPPFASNNMLKGVSEKRMGFSLTKPLKILYAGSKKSSELNLESSFNTVTNGLARHINKGTIKLIRNLHVNTTNIFDILIKHRPNIFHFSGKQDGGDIRITDEFNNVTTISDVELAGYLTSFGDTMKLAIIDTCYSYNCARSISDVVDFAIGVKDIIYEVDADKFYKVFYNALCAGYSLRDAVGQATASLKFRKVPHKQIPVLFSKNTADASKAYFVQ